MSHLTIDNTQLSIDDGEAKALKILRKYSDKGILQAKLFEELGIDAKEGVKIIHRLLKKSIIRRERIVIDGRKTYRVLLGESKKYDSIVSLDTVIKIPCFTCPFFKECGVGGTWNPLNCDILEEWLEKEYKKTIRT